MVEIDLETIEKEQTYIVRLPGGRLLELEWLCGEKTDIRVVGFASEQQYLADEEYRLAGYQPLLRCFAGYISVA